MHSISFRKFVAFFLVTTLVDQSYSKVLTVDNCGQSKFPSYFSDRIVGGENARPGEYPFMVSIRELDDDFGFDHVCGGAILNENWIITAAHCIEMPYAPRLYQAFVGLHKLSEEKTATVRKHRISEIIIHEEYDDDTFKNDIALLKTSRPIDISGSSGYINGICLPSTTDDPVGYATVIGWGFMRHNGYNSDTLKKVLLPIIDRELCSTSYNDPNDEEDSIFDTMICAGMTGRDSCQNDSGGPLFQTDEKGTATLIGVVSHGRGCAEKFYPGVYTKVSMYKDWLDKVIS